MSNETDFPKSYMRLRTLLDSLQVNALRYCLDGADHVECVSRMSAVESELLDFIGKVGGESPCDAGYYNCGGVCVPYQCFEGYLQSPEQAPAAASAE